MGQLGPFKIGERAGQGAMASVWYGEHVETETPVAIKVIEMTRGIADGDVYRFRSEVRASARVVHPGALRIFDEGVIERPDVFTGDHSIVEGCPYIVMEWAPKGTLVDRANQLGWTELKGVLLSLLDALSAAHARGIIHRDIKPANVLFAERGLVLADFGVAYIGDAESNDREVRKVVGSPNYMAPEQILCRWRDFGPWTDLYSVGAMTWLLTTGRAPFAGQNSREILAAHLKKPLGEYLPRFAVPAGLFDWIKRLMSKSPRNRYALAADAAYALELMGQPEDVGRGKASLLGVALDSYDKTLMTPSLLLPAHDDAWGTLDTTRPSGPPVPSCWRKPEAVHRGEALRGVGQRIFSTVQVEYTGREPERDVLWSALKECAEKGPRAVVIDGAPGVGKSAIVQWLSCRAHEAGAANRLWFRHGEGQPSLDAVREGLSRQFRTAGMEGDERCTRLRALLERWHASELAEELDALIADEQRSVALEGGAIALASSSERHLVLTRLVRAMAAERPLLVFLDDVQWGEFCLSWVEKLLGEATDLPVLFVLTRRVSSIGGQGGLGDRIDALLELDEVKRIALGPLSPVDAAAMIAARIRLSQSTMERLVEQADGNPLYAEQLVTHWIDTDALVSTEDGFSVVEGGVTEAPGTVFDLWEQRLAKFRNLHDDDVGSVLELSACLGMRFPRSELRGVCELAGLPLPAEAITALSEAELVFEEDGQVVSLVHELLVSAARKSAERQGRWGRWNQICGEWLSRSERPSWYRIGRHRYFAGEYERAVTAFHRESRHRQEIGELREALETLGLAALSLRRAGVSTSDPRWAQTRSRYGTCQRELGLLRSALRHTRQGMAALDREAHPGPYAECLLSHGQTMKFVADQNAALPMLKEAVELATKLGGTQLEFDSRRTYAGCLRDVGRTQDSREQFVECHRLLGEGWLDALEPIPRASVRISYFLERCQQTWVAGSAQAAAEYADLAARIADDIGSRWRVAVALLLKGRVLLSCEHYGEALRALESSAARYESIGHSGRYSADGYAGVAMIQMGQYEEGLVKMQDVREGLERMGRWQSARYGETFKLGALARLGRWSQWDKAFQDLSDLVDGGMFGAIFARMTELSLAHLVDLGEKERAATVGEVLVRNYTQQGADRELARFEAALAGLGLSAHNDGTEG